MKLHILLMSLLLVLSNCSADKETISLHEYRTEANNLEPDIEGYDQVIIGNYSHFKLKKDRHSSVDTIWGEGNVYIQHTSGHRSLVVIIEGNAMNFANGKVILKTLRKSRKILVLEGRGVFRRKNREVNIYKGNHVLLKDNGFAVI